MSEPFEPMRDEVAAVGGADGSATAAADGIRRLQVLAAALSASVLFYTLVAWFLISVQGLQLRPILPRDADVVAAGLAGVLILVSTRLRQRLAAPPRTVLSSPRPPSEAERLRRYARAVTVSLAMREAVGLIGLVLALLTGEARWAMVFGLASLLALLAAWPRRRELQRLTR